MVNNIVLWNITNDELLKTHGKNEDDYATLSESLLMTLEWGSQS